VELAAARPAQSDGRIAVHGLTRNRRSIALARSIGLPRSLQAATSSGRRVDIQLPTPPSNSLSSPAAIVPLLTPARSPASTARALPLAEGPCDDAKNTESVVAVRLGRRTNRRLSASVRLATVGFGHSPCSVRR